jgi:glucose/arabinose dehydrogenase
LYVAGCGGSSETVPPPQAPPAPGGGGDGGGSGGGGGTPSTPDLTTEVVASGLTVPWEMVFTPDGRMFFTEQNGRVRVISAAGDLITQPALDLTGEVPGGEAGMLGLAADRGFQQNHFLYLFYCRGSADAPTCRVVRLLENDNRVSIDRVLLEFAGARHHNAGRLKIGPDGLLYLTIGDLGDPANGQRLNNYGSILRMNLDGTPAAGNPFPEAPYVFAMGFRDPQGIAWDSSGQLYATEHGPVSNDELDRVEIGKNYGWADCVGRCGDPRWVDPVRLWEPETLAPSGATFYNSAVIPQWSGSLLIASLGLADNTYAKHIHRIKFDAPGGSQIVEEEILYRGEFGRIRNVVEGPDGFVYFSTSRGRGEDRIVRIRPK